MAKQHKIKKYSQKATFFPSNNRFSVVRFIVGILVLVALVFIGISAYNPVKDFISGKTKPNPLPEAPKIVTPNESTVSPEPIIETTPEPEIKSEPVSVHGIELNYETASDPVALDKFINTLPAEINTIVFNVKDNKGKIFYKTSNKEAIKWEAVVENPIDISQLSQKLQNNSLNLAVRMSVFSDPIAARGDFENNAILHSSGVIWIDNTLSNGGKPWTTPYSEQVRNYNQNLAEELSKQGVSLIILNYMRFPNDPTNSANLKIVDGVSKSQILTQFYTQTASLIGDTRLATSITLSNIEQKETGLNPDLYGDDPMKIDVPLWMVDIGDLLIDNEYVTTQIKTPENSKKEFIFYSKKDKNPNLSTLSEYEFILY